MSETLKNSGENQDTQASTGFESLTTIEFDKEKAERLVEKEKEAKLDNGSEFLKVQSKSETEKVRPVDELTPEEASQEYLDLLADLSQNFTSAEGKTGKAAKYDEDGNIRIINQNGYSGSKDRIVGQLHGQDTERELSLDMADRIIAAESDWRAAGESTTIEAEQTEKAALEQSQADARAKLDKIEHGFLGKLKKAFFVSFRSKEYNRLYTLANSKPQTKAEKSASAANTKLQKALETAYSEDYGYGHHELSFAHTQEAGYRDRINQEYNDRFFSPERKAKIDRAIELRRKLEAEKLIKK